MSWRISGEYVANCNCVGVCPCPVDAKPTAPGGQCYGAIVFNVQEGKLEGTNLSGVNFGLVNHFPSNLSSGSWKIGLIIDEGASDEQASAIENIVSGKEGGMFAELAPLISDFLGTERAKVTYSDGDTPSGSIGQGCRMSFEPLRGEDGSPTTVKNAMFGFAPEFKIGMGKGSTSLMGIDFESSYGECAHYEFSDQPGTVRGRG